VRTKSSPVTEPLSGRSDLIPGTGAPNLVQPGSGKKLPVSFYRTAAGAEPVRDWLKGLPENERIAIGRDIKAAEYGWPVGLPLCRPLGNGLWEVRTELPTRIARVIFSVYEGRMLLLHGFIKKQQKTPQSDINLARARKRRMEKAK